MKTKVIVSKESLQKMLDSDNITFVNKVIGRALVGLFDRQTKSEQYSDTTNEDNGVGFAGCDAYSGSLTAKYFLRHKRLLEWQREIWLKKNKKGVSRLAKYHRQLNEIAVDKKKRKENSQMGLIYD